MFYSWILQQCVSISCLSTYKKSKKNLIRVFSRSEQTGIDYFYNNDSYFLSVNNN